MKLSISFVIFGAAMLAFSACGRKSETAASNSAPAAQAPATTPTAPPPAAPPSGPITTPAATAPATAPAPAQAPPTAQPAPATPATTAERVSPQPAAPQAPPPPAKPVTRTYTLPAGTPITVRTTAEVNSKIVKSGNEFQAVLENPLAADGHTFAKQGATVVGNVLNSDEGGRVKGKASLTLGLSRIQMTNGKMTAVATDSVTQEAKSGTKKNLARTGIATGVGTAVGAIAGGGQGAAIGAGVGAGAGVATNMATRGPAADIPAETLLHFTLKNPISITVTETPSSK